MKEEHSDPSVVAELAVRAEARSVLLYHLVPGMDRGDALVAEVKKGYSGQVIASQDMDRYCLSSARRGAGLVPCGR